ncbi:MAG: glycosyltransferase family 39 protein [Candidatus Longimicrobiales bacterium M2_2A_002]
MKRGRSGVPAGLSVGVPALAGAVVLVHLAVAAWGPYGLHRDALLYLAMGEHLHLLRMDFPPFIALVAATERLLGDSLVVIHLGTALAHGALVLLAGVFARRAGGRAPSQLVAALVVATAPVYMRAGALFQPVVFDQLWWTLALLALARIPAVPIRSSRDRRRGDSRLSRVRLSRSDGGRWALLGMVLGLGLLTKFTILILGAAILVGVAATPLRRWLATPWPWAAAALSFVIGAPSITGQMLLDWPFFNQLSDLQASQLQRVTPTAFTLEQLLMVGPAVLIAVAGAIAVLVRRRDAGLQAVAWTAIAAFVIMLLAGGKAYYIAPIWPALLGIGLAEIERWARRLREGEPPLWEAGGRRASATVRPAADDAEPATRAGSPAASGAQGSTAGRSGPRPRPGAAMTVWGIVAVAVGGFAVIGLPMGLPVLPPETMARYAAWLGVTEVVTTNTGEQLELPQDYADMLGWERLADSVTQVYRSLPPEDREQAVILATNYGRAGAIDFYAGDEIPHAVSPVGSYWYWGPGDRPGQVTIVVGAEPEDVLGEYFAEATLAARVRNPWGVPEERNVGIVVARDPIRPLQQVWPEWRGIN